MNLQHVKDIWHMSQRWCLQKSFFALPGVQNPMIPSLHYMMKKSGLGLGVWACATFFQYLCLKDDDSCWYFCRLIVSALIQTWFNLCDTAWSSVARRTATNDYVHCQLLSWLINWRQMSIRVSKKWLLRMSCFAHNTKIFS